MPGRLELGERLQARALAASQDQRQNLFHDDFSSYATSRLLVLFLRLHGSKATTDRMNRMTRIQKEDIPKNSASDL